VRAGELLVDIEAARDRKLRGLARFVEGHWSVSPSSPLTLHASKCSKQKAPDRGRDRRTYQIWVGLILCAQGLRVRVRSSVPGEYAYEPYRGPSHYEMQKA
jgi:hypothetical protein